MNDNVIKCNFNNEKSKNETNNTHNVADIFHLNIPLKDIPYKGLIFYNEDHLNYYKNLGFIYRLFSYDKDEHDMMYEYFRFFELTMGY